MKKKGTADIEDIVDKARDAVYNYAYEAKEKRKKHIAHFLLLLAAALFLTAMVLSLCVKSEESFAIMMLCIVLPAVILGLIGASICDDGRIFCSTPIASIIAIMLMYCFYAAVNN